MTDNTAQPSEPNDKRLKGYRDLTQTEVDMMNEIKAFGPQLDALYKKINEHLTDQRISGARSETDDERDRMNQAEPEKWLELGKADLQQGLMKMTRSIAQPSFF